MERGCGILLPVSSLPCEYGFGCFSKDAFEFIDYLADLGVKYWQVLPLGIVDEVGSPYSSLSAYAGEPLYIDLSQFLSREEIQGFGLSNELGFDEYRQRKMKALWYCFEKNNKELNLEKFLQKNEKWVYCFATYISLVEKFGVGYSGFPEEYKDMNSTETAEFISENSKRIQFHIFLQYLFFEQWEKVKNYANSKNVKIIGDVPIYCSMDSVEMYSNRNIFLLDNNGKPKYISAVPGDYFNPEGQIWNNPLYDYKYLRQDNFKWWVDRLKHLNRFYDYIRIDHFRGFESFFAVPYGDTTVKNGKWINGPGMKIFKAFYDNGIKNLILEDLGIISNAVVALRKKTGLAGMKVMQFAFDGDPENLNLPHKYTENSVAYIGTHDNDTLIGLLSDEVQKERFCEYFNISKDTDKKTIVEIAIENLLSTKSNVCVLTMQDILFEDSECRINTPGTTEGNWCYKLNPNYKNSEFNKYLKELIKLKNR